MKTLRQRIRPEKIRLIGMLGEIYNMPISSKTLFARYGVPIDIVERDLKEEGYLLPNEVLLEVLKIEENLYRDTSLRDEHEDIEYGSVPEDWTEEDYKWADLALK